jgi:hypothetical protein
VQLNREEYAYIRNSICRTTICPSHSADILHESEAVCAGTKGDIWVHKIASKTRHCYERPRHDAEHCTNNSNENKLHEFFELAGFDEDNYMQICDNIGEESDHALSGCTSTK